MKKYRIKVNGKVFEVELEAVEEVKEEVKPVEKTVDTANGKTINAPIGGKVIDVKVKVGDTLKKGDLVCIIEAMKMENEVLANVAGTVKAVNVTKGSQVANKEALIVLE